MSSAPYPTKKTAIGIGRDRARRLSRAGWSLGLIDLAEMPLGDLTHWALGLGASGAVAADIADPDAIDAAARRFAAEFPPVLAIVNIAGVSDPTPFVDTSLECWNRVLRINLTEAFVVIRRFTSGVVQRGFSRIVTLFSTAAQNGGGTCRAATYAASKASVERMTRALALEVAAKGIAANAIAPAIVDTDVMGARIDEARLPYFASRLPVGRLRRVNEVSALIEFLTGPDASYITGATYNLNGGARIG